jgi:hypothetical protein
MLTIVINNRKNEKIEELYLYIIELNEKLNKLQNSTKNTK